MFKEEFLKQKVIISFIIFFMVWFSFGFLDSKEGITPSEALSYAVVNAVPIQTTIDTTSTSLQSSNPVWHEQAYYETYTSLKDGNSFSYSTVYENCTQNGLAPLYYFVLHTFVSLFHYIIPLSFISFALNSIFLFGTCYMIFLIGAKQLHNGWLGIGASILFGFSVASISGMICTEPFIMLLFFLVTFFYLLLKFLEEKEVRGSVCRAFVLVTMLGCLTDYSFLAFIAISSILFLLVLLCFRHFKDFFIYLFTLSISLLFTLALYPSIVLHFLDGTLLLQMQTDTTEFSSLLVDGLLFIKEYLLIKEGLFVGMLLIILGLLALVLNKYTVKLQLESFVSRIKEMELNDVFLTLFTLLYFMFLLLYIPNDNYNYWVGIFPFVSLLVVYLACRFAKGFISSEYNSSMIGIVMSCLVCIFGINCTNPMFLNEGYNSQLNLAKQYANANCIFIEDSIDTSLAHILEIQCYQNTMLLDAKSLENMKVDKVLKESNPLIVYVNKNYDTDDIVLKLAKDGNYHFHDTLSLKESDMAVYKLYR